MSRFQLIEARNDQSEIILNPRQQLVLSQTGNHGVTDKYKTVTTLDVVQDLQNQGFQLKSVAVSGVRKASKDGFQKHFVTLSHPDLVFGAGFLNEARPEIKIINSYDGLSSYRLSLLVKRLVCLNGLTAAVSIDGFRFRHVGTDLLSQINTAVDQIKSRIPEVTLWIGDLQNTILSQDQQVEYAHRASQLLDLPQGENVTTRVNLRSLLKVTRPQDAGDSLWVVHNRVQERIVKGGVQYQVETIEANGAKTVRSNTTRQVNSIDNATRLNAGLAELSKEFSKVS